MAILFSFSPEYFADAVPAPLPSGQVRIRYSNDGAHNWGDWRVISAGETGDFLKDLVWRRLGMCRHRVWEFEDTSAYPGAVLAASIQADSQ